MIQFHDRCGEMITERLGVSEKTVALNDRYHGKPGHGGNWVATERAAMTARTEYSRGLASCNAGSNRKPVPQSFGYSDNVRGNALVDVHQPAAAATQPGPA